MKLRPTRPELSMDWQMSRNVFKHHYFLVARYFNTIQHRSYWARFFYELMIRDKAQ